MNAFFTLAAVSPTRQQSLRTLVAAHVIAIACILASMQWSRSFQSPMMLGNVLLIAGIIEGALIVGWRLAQIPKSQALEFLLVSQLSPSRVFLGEALVGLARLALVTLSGLPILIYMVQMGMLLWMDVFTMLAISYFWGAVTGLGLATWAYESTTVRKIGERVVILGIVGYLVVGVLAAEHLPIWLSFLPRPLAIGFLKCFYGFHEYNPFGVIRFALENPEGEGVSRVLFIVGLGVLLTMLGLWRGSCRLLGHYRDLHYRPLSHRDRSQRPAVGDRPLTWWAVKRVSRYSGRINLWLAGGFVLMYAAYTIAGDHWPAWLGRSVFVIFENLGGVPALATSLVLLAAVPAAFQYGLWDASAQDRCRRLELLLLTRLEGESYWHAAAGAAWNRGRGYFVLAMILWASAFLAGRISFLEMTASFAAGLILWGLYFALGFRAFSRGSQANLLGLFLTIILPVATILGHRVGWDAVSQLLPPGSVFFSPAQSWLWFVGPLLASVLTLLLIRHALIHCDANLRQWYDLHHGARGME